MLLIDVAISACLMLNVTPSVAKKCEKIIKEECFTKKQYRSYKECYMRVSPEINVLMKKQYAKACLIQ